LHSNLREDLQTAARRKIEFGDQKVRLALLEKIGGRRGGFDLRDDPAAQILDQVTGAFASDPVGVGDQSREKHSQNGHL